MTTPLNPQQDPRDEQDQQDPTRALEEGAPATAPSPESSTDVTDVTDVTDTSEATESPEATGILEDDTTRPVETGVPSDSVPPAAPQATWAPAAGTGSAPQEPAVAELPRPTGPHAPAIVLGVVLTAIAGLVIAQEVGSLRVDWGDVGPLGIVAAGAMLVLFGLLGLLTSRRNQA